mmetsp:Transcript_101004/g.320634  ORF Transcript_101004/g.320634 Transcript_101004/m.320634 type:complete len:252 (+) Transcript_101004:309-1064(+)
MLADDPRVLALRQDLAGVDPGEQPRPLLPQQGRRDRLPAPGEAGRVLVLPLVGRAEGYAAAQRQGHDSNHVVLAVGVDEPTKDEEGGGRRGDGEVAARLLVEGPIAQRVAPGKIDSGLRDLQCLPHGLVQRNVRQRSHGASGLHVPDLEVVDVCRRALHRELPRLQVHRQLQILRGDQGKGPEVLGEDAAHLVVKEGALHLELRQADGRGDHLHARGHQLVLQLGGVLHEAAAEGADAREVGGPRSVHDNI